MNFDDDGTMIPYRISKGRRGSRWHRWQSEAPDLCRFARRGRTARAAHRRMRHDAWIALTGGTAWGQQWRIWRADHHLPDHFLPPRARAKETTP